MIYFKDLIIKIEIKKKNMYILKWIKNKKVKK